MSRKTIALALTLGLTTVTLVGCSAGSNGDDAIENSGSASETPTPSEPSESESWSPNPSDLEDLRDEDGSPTEWPLTIPKPPGPPLPGNDTPVLYTVAGDRDTYLDYLRQLRETKDASEMYSTGQDLDGATFEIAEYTLVVVFSEDGDESLITVSLTST